MPAVEGEVGAAVGLAPETPPNGGNGAAMGPTVAEPGMVGSALEMQSSGRSVAAAVPAVVGVAADTPSNGGDGAAPTTAVPDIATSSHELRLAAVPTAVELSARYPSDTGEDTSGARSDRVRQRSRKRSSLGAPFAQSPCAGST